MGINLILVRATFAILTQWKECFHQALLPTSWLKPYGIWFLFLYLAKFPGRSCSYLNKNYSIVLQSTTLHFFKRQFDLQSQPKTHYSLNNLMFPEKNQILTRMPHSYLRTHLPNLRSLQLDPVHPQWSHRLCTCSPRQTIVIDLYQATGGVPYMASGCILLDGLQIMRACWQIPISCINATCFDPFWNESLQALLYLISEWGSTLIKFDLNLNQNVI